MHIYHLFQWSKASDVEIDQYRMKSYTDLGSIIIPAAKRTDNHCNSHEHQKQLDSYYDNICNVLTSSSRPMQTIPTSKIKCPSEYIIPGFNDYLKELHNNARSSYLLWKHSGKPRGITQIWTCEQPGYNLNMLWDSVVAMRK